MNQKIYLKLTRFDGRLCGDFDMLIRCESCDDVEICEVFINEGSEWMLLEKTSLMPMSDSQSPTLIVLIRSAMFQASAKKRRKEFNKRTRK
jgi:hypothetical protein